jgi:anhydro-N-acetylmuramic acid kinase
MTHPLLTLLGKQPKRVVGLMSGTSIDGIDAALCEIEGTGPDARVRVLDFRFTPYRDDERALIHSLLQGDASALCQGSFALGRKLADAALAVAGGAPIDLVGSHGQTVWNQPPSLGAGTPSTLQLGEPAVIAARTGAITVADFRVADVAQGGEGAPLVPFADWVLFRRPGRARALQNIGGIANVTLVTDELARVIAFDSGPGNMMIDALMPAASDGRDTIDRDGAFSARGRVQEDLLRELLADPYLQLPPPKSTGRERYGVPATRAWAARHADRAPLDLLATVVAFTARAIADAVTRFVLPRAPVDELVVSGGGAHNRTLMAELGRALAPLPVRALDEGGVSVDAKEAVAFALLAVACVHAQPANVPSVTGARRPTILGKISLP